MSDATSKHHCSAVRRPPSRRKSGVALMYLATVATHVPEVDTSTSKPTPRSAAVRNACTIGLTTSRKPVTASSTM
jgi:hypothetical protein